MRTTLLIEYLSVRNRVNVIRTNALKLLGVMLLLLPMSAIAQIYVSPGESINSAIDNAGNGSTIILEDGRYHQTVNIDKSITLKAQNPGQAIIDGGTTQSFNWTQNGNEWSANVSWNPNHLVVGHLSIIRMGTDLKNEGFQGGFYYNNGKVHARLTDNVNPNNVHVSVQRSSGANRGITVNANNVTVEGLVIQCHSSAGIKVNSDNFTARDNLIIGSRCGIDMGDRQGDGHLIEYNEITNYPLFQGARHSYNLMVRVYHNDNDGGIFNSETTAIRFGSLNTIVRYNHFYEHMDGMQPRKMVQNNSSDRSYVYNNFIWNNRDDGVEFDSNGPQNLRFHNNVVMGGTAVIAPSPVQNGPTLIDHNLVLDVPYNDGGVNEKHVMFKFDGDASWTDGYMRNLRIVHNTVVSTNNDGRLWWTQPDNGQSNCMIANNIIDVENELNRSFPLPEDNNFRSNSVNFENRSGEWDLRLTSSSGAIDYGSSSHDDFHQYSDGSPDAGAIEYGSQWDFQSVGPRWGNSANMPQRPALPNVINPETVGLGESSDYIVLAPGTLEFESNASDQSLDVSSDMSWTASSSDSWLSVNPTNGSSNATLTVSVDANNSGSERTGTITVSGSGVSEDVTVIQDIPCILPSPWSNQDIGSVSAAGEACENNGVFSIEGSGSDIYGTADGFQYMYQTLSGDGEITARVSNITNTDPWAKAGVMIRDELTAGSVHGLMHLSAENGLQFQTRTSTDGTTSTGGSASGSAPQWIRIEKSGNTLTGFMSADGSTWTEVGSQTVSMSGDNYIGLAVTSHNDGVLNEVAFDNVSLGGITTYTITANAGSNGNISPSGNVSVNEGGSQTFTIAPDEGYDIADVTVDGSSVGNENSYTFTNVVSNHSITASFEESDDVIGARIELDPYGDWDNFDFRVDNNATSANITSIDVSLGGSAVFDYIADGGSFTASPNGGAHNNGSTVSNTTINFSGSGLPAGGSDDNGAGVSDVDNAAITSVDITVNFSDGSSLSGTMNNVGDSDDGDPELWVFEDSEGTTPTTYTITASAGSNGSISPSGNISVTEGNNESFTISADFGYEIDDVVVDGNSVGVVNNYTFSNVTTNHTISASFVQEQIDNLNVRLELDPFGDWDNFNFRAYNNSTSQSITSIDLSLGGSARFDYFADGNSFTASPNGGSGNNGTVVQSTTLTFSGSGLVAGGSDNNNGSHSDVDNAAISSVNVTVNFGGGDVLTGTMTNEGDSDDGDPELWVFEQTQSSSTRVGRLAGRESRDKRNNNFSIYPNPVNNKLQIDIQNQTTDQPINYYIIDLNGKHVQEGKLMGTVNSIDVSLLNKGTYMLQLSNTNANEILKIIVE